MDTQWEMLYGNVNSLSLFKKTIITLFFPWYYLGMVAIIKKDIQQTTQRILTFLIYAIPFYLWIALMSMSKKYKNVDSIGWAVVLGLVIYSSMLRRSVRRRWVTTRISFPALLFFFLAPDDEAALKIFHANIYVLTFSEICSGTHNLRTKKYYLLNINNILFC